MFLNKIQRIINNNKKIIENFSYLSILQILNLALPLITYPYLIKVLGADLYGMIIYSQVIISYFSIIINYGFEASATKDISVNRRNKIKISNIVSSVLEIKLFLWLISFIILLILIYLLPSFSNNKILYLFTFTLTFNEFLFPVWYFQGMEKMKFITLINGSVKVLF